jgi:hypothetical protein
MLVSRLSCASYFQLLEAPAWVDLNFNNFGGFTSKKISTFKRGEFVTAPLVVRPLSECPSLSVPSLFPSGASFFPATPGCYLSGPLPDLKYEEEAASLSIAA